MHEDSSSFFSENCLMTMPSIRLSERRMFAVCAPWVHWTRHNQIMPSTQCRKLTFIYTGDISSSSCCAASTQVSLTLSLSISLSIGLSVYIFHRFRQVFMTISSVRTELLLISSPAVSYMSCSFYLDGFRDGRQVQSFTFHFSRNTGRVYNCTKLTTKETLLKYVNLSKTFIAFINFTHTHKDLFTYRPSFRGQVGWGYRIHWLHPTSVLDIWH